MDLEITKYAFKILRKQLIYLNTLIKPIQYMATRRCIQVTTTSKLCQILNKQNNQTAKPIINRFSKSNKKHGIPR